MRRTRIAAVLAALLLAGCGSATGLVTPSAPSGSTTPTQSVTSSSGAAPVIAPGAMLIVGRAGQADLYEYEIRRPGGS